MKRILILILLSIIFISKSYTQEYYKLEEMFLDADSWFYYEDYKEALPLFLRVLEADSLNYNVMYKIGYCYLNIPGQKDKAIPYLENAIKRTTFNYRKNTYTEKEAPVDALFYLGNAYLVNNRINEAIDAYTGFQNKITRTQRVANKDIYDTDYLKRQFDACRNAIQFQNRPVNFIARNIGDKINSRFNEFNAVVSGDGSTMVFTASLKFYDAIFYTKKDSSGNWGYPINLMGQLGVDDKSATTGLSYDGTELYIYRDDNFDGNIYVSYLKNGFWTKVHKLGENINTKYWESHASVSPDDKKLYFVSNREGGFGDLDIYVSERVTDTTWGVATNLGSVINTRWNENTPFLTPDGKRLFFSSEGHEGMGGYDIFYSDLNADSSWSEPVNVGYPINTTDNDLFFVPFQHGNFAYCSQFSKQGFGGQDIYHYQLLDIVGYSNILVEGIQQMDNPVGQKKESFIINIIDKVNKDTIAVLHPGKDNLNYEYQTPLGVNHLVYESPFEDNKSQFFISANYKIKDVYQSTAKQETPELANVDSMPNIILDTNMFKTDQKNIKIKLSLQKGNKLFVNTFYKDKLINSEEFDITKENFIYEYKPLPGESKIKFKLVDKNNNIKTEEVTVSYLPKDTHADLSIAEKVISLGANGEKHVKIKLSVEKGSKLYVETYVDGKLVNNENFNINKDSFVYEFEPKGEKSKLNFKLVDKYNNVKNEQVVISNTPVNKDFAEVLNGITNFNSNEFKALLKSPEIKSASSIQDFISQIYAKAAEFGLSKEQTQALLIALAINSTKNTPEFISGLLKQAKGDLKSVLDSVNINKDQFKNNLAVIQFLELQSKSKNYNNQDVAELLENYLKNSGIPVPILLANLDTILKTDIANILTNLDASAIDIVSIDDFKKYLASTNKYSAEELNQLYAVMEGMLISSNATKEVNPPNTIFEEVIAGIKNLNREKFNTILKSTEIQSASSIEELLSQIYTKAAALGLSKEQTQALIIALAINSTENTPEFILGLLNLSKGDLKFVLDSIQTNNVEFTNNLSVIQFLELKSRSKNYTNRDIIELLENYLKNSDIPVSTLLANLDTILKTDIASILSNLDSSASNIASLDDFKKYLIGTNKYSEEELKQLFALIEGMNISLNAYKEIKTPVEEAPIAAKESNKQKNAWMIFYISLTGILLGLIIIFLNRRRNKGNKKTDI